MRNRLTKGLCALLMCCFAGALASSAVAQERMDYGRRGQFGPDLERLLRQTENHTRQFAAMLDNDNRDRNWLGERARELENQLNMVGGDYDQGSNFNRRSQLGTVLRVAQSINNAMRYRRVGYDVQRQWSMVRSDLNRLARAYDLRQI